MIQITDKKDCCGCNVCGDACPKHAISFNVDKEGFWYPKVDIDRCIDCHKCESVCPVFNADTLKKNDLSEPLCYVAEHKNLEVVFASTSGGMFTALAERMYKQGGYVGGAIFNDDFSVRHYISNDEDDLKIIRGSKYIQSDASNFFVKVKELLQNDKKVLLCAAPCQIAALKSFLRRDYDNLLTVDFICLGVNSPKVWQKFLSSIEEKYGSKIVSVRAKSKELGWRNLTYKFTLKNGLDVFETKDECAFQKGYIHKRVFCRPSCYECKFKGFPRIADISIADFWGEKHSDLDKNLGLSLVMINSFKGKSFFEEIQSKINKESISLEEAVKGNDALFASLRSTLDRDLFFDDLDRLSFDQLADKYFNEKKVQKRSVGAVYFRVKKYLTQIAIVTCLKPKPLYQFLKFNSFKDIIAKNVIIPTPYTVLDIHPNAKIIKNGIVIIGQKRIKGSKLETRILLEEGSTLEFKGGYTMSYGADIEVFRGATLSFGENGYSNVNLTLICAGKISIGKRVFFGRNVTIRDNNGGHYINRFGYKNIRPVTVADDVWICEQSTIMSGVKIGTGSVVGAKSFVIDNVPAHTMVSGHPAQVVDKDILWKH